MITITVSNIQFCLLAFALFSFCITHIRYRLVGEALEIASRLKALGEGRKIHISIDTKLRLDSLGGFCTEHNGLFDLQVRQLTCVSSRDSGIHILKQEIFLPLIVCICLQTKGQQLYQTYWLLGKEGECRKPSIRTEEHQDHVVSEDIATMVEAAEIDENID